MIEAGWTITDHVCRVCYGRVLTRTTEAGTEARCACCGLSHTVATDQRAVAHRSICACSTQPRGAGKVRMQCVPNPCRTPEVPVEIAVIEI